MSHPTVLVHKISAPRSVAAVAYEQRNFCFMFDNYHCMFLCPSRIACKGCLAHLAYLCRQWHWLDSCPFGDPQPPTTSPPCTPVSYKNSGMGGTLDVIEKRRYTQSIFLQFNLNSSNFHAYCSACKLLNKKWLFWQYIRLVLCKFWTVQYKKKG